MFLVARVMSGIGAGIIVSNTPVYMSEICPPHSRGALVSAQGIVITSSYVVSNAIALAFSFVRPSYQWRLQFITQTTISVMLMVVVFFFCPKALDGLW